VAGTIRYVVGDGPLDIGGGGSASAPVDRAVSTGLATSHWLSFAGVGMVGGSWLIFTLWPAGRQHRAIRRLVWFGWGMAAVGAVTEYLLEGPYAAGTGLATVTRTQLLNATLQSSTGSLLSLRVLLLGVLGIELTSLLGSRRVPAGDPAADDPERRPSWAPEAAAIVGAGIVVTFAASGHTRSASPRWLWVLVDAVHLVAMIVWLGGVLVLLVAAISHRRGRPGVDGADLEADRTQLAAALPVFSRVAMGCIATLAVTGTLQAWREVRALDALAGTRYGQLVLVKVALFCAILGLGYLARRVVLRSAAGAGRPASPDEPVTGAGVPAGSDLPSGAEPSGADLASSGAGLGTATALSSRVAVRAQPGLPARLRRTLLVEVVIGALVLAATAVLVSQPPGKVALAAERSKPRQVSVRVNATTEATVRVTPGVHGNVRFAVRLDGGPAATDVTATASLPAQQLGPIPVPLKGSGPGSYTSAVVSLPVAGTWEIALTVQTSEFDSTVALARIKVF
jgi:copper transport protein